MSIKENKENVGEKTEEKVVSVIKDWLETAENDSGTWRDRQDKWYRLRMRVKTKKTKPFKGCSNLRMPTLDTAHKKLGASVINGIFSVRPVVQVIPTPGGSEDQAVAIEKFLDHLIMDVIKIKPIATMAVDQSLQNGFELMKPYWNIKVYTRTIEFDVTELSEDELTIILDPSTPKEIIMQALATRFEIDTSTLVIKENIESVREVMDAILAGKEKVVVKFRDVIKNHPDVSIVPSAKLMVPQSTEVDPQSAQYLIHEFFIDYNTFVQNVENKGWSRSALDTIDYSRNLDLTQAEVTRSQREGIELVTNKNLIRIWECYCYWDLNGDGKEEKCIITISPDFDLKLRSIEIPFKSYKFPFVKLYYELTSNGWYSHRGLPELLEDLVKEIDTQHMQRIDSQTLRNSPMFLFRAGQIKGKSKNFGFGRGIPVSGHNQLNDTIAPFNATNTNAEFSYKDEQQILESKIAELIGQVDFSLQSQINRRQPRTADEVQMHVQSASVSNSLVISQYRQQFEELFNWIYELWCQFGDDQYEFNYFGPNKLERIKIDREAIQGKYTIKVRANDNNSNPQINQQKASLVLQDTYTAFSAGLAGPEAVLEARKQAMIEMGIENWERFITPPQPRQPQPPIQPIVIQMSDLTDAERAQVLHGIGVVPDVNGRVVNKIKDENQQQFENNLEISDQLIKAENARQNTERKEAP